MVKLTKCQFVEMKINEKTLKWDGQAGRLRKNS